MKFERKMAFKALVGSHNYNLNAEDSDKDYKLFVLPTFEDLYKGEFYSKTNITSTVDFDIHDIRKLPQLFYKANINFLETLFSNEIVYSEELTKQQRKLVDEIFKMKNEIAKMNISYLFNACRGMHFQKMKLLEKGTVSTQHLVEKFGYSTKMALHAYRALDFMVRFSDNDFSDFKNAMTYTDEEREFMLEIKYGKFDLESFKNFVEFYREAKFESLAEKCKMFEVDKDTNDKLVEIIMELVRISI